MTQSAPPVIEVLPERGGGEFPNPVQPPSKSVKIGPSWADLGIITVALLWWLWTLAQIDLGPMNDLGLISVLPPAFAVPLVLLSGHFLWRLFRERHPPTWPMLLHLAALVVVVQGTLPILYDAPRFVWTYKHLGVIEYLIEERAVDRTIDAYHNWPGFFALFGQLFATFGLRGSEQLLAAWAPVYFDLLYLLPLLVIFRALVKSDRVVWLGLWLFVLGNWTNQDYFSPQAMAYLLCLIVVALVLHAGPQWTPIRLTPRLIMQRPLVAAVIVLVMLALVSSHQLSPFMLMALLASLVVTRLWSAAAWFTVLAGLTLFWDTQMASTFLRSDTNWLDAIGRLGQNLLLNRRRAVEYSADHMLVLKVTQVSVIALWFTALLGVIRMGLARRLNWRLMGLAAAPLPMIALSSYGGEMLLRIYFFSMPYMSLLAASALVGPGRPEAGQPRQSRGWPVAVTLTFITLTTISLYFNAFGNERTNRVRRSDVQTVEALYRLAPARSGIVVFSVDSLPIKLTGQYADYLHMQLIDNREEVLVRLTPGDYQYVKEQLRDAGAPAGYIVFSLQQQRYMSTFRLLAPGSYARFQQLVASDPQSRLVYRRGQTRIYRIQPAPPAGGF